MLLENHHQGDASALQAIVQRDIEWVRGFVHRHLDGELRRLDDTGDIVQEVMLTVLTKGQLFIVEDKDDLRALIGTIVLNHLRSRGRYLHADKRDARRERAGLGESVLYFGKDSPARCVASPAQQAEQAEAIALVRLAREIIDPASREILELRDNGMTFLAIGERLDCQEDAARKRHGAAVRQLQDGVQKLKRGRLRDLASES